ncbi:Glycosyl transferase [Planctomycetales bacterium 10988]|nr:Glycosyl transferase [Planctomycetales bacterium 10988]
MTRPQLSVVLITRNEAAHLRELLPLLAWADEVIVLDSGSTDDTVAIAKEYRAVAQVRPFDTFADQRNAACDLARGEWILSIDADERPSTGMPAEIRRHMETTNLTAFRIRIKSHIFGHPMAFGGTQDDRPIRLFRKDHACWEGSVHEVLRVDGEVGHLATTLTHYTLPTLDAFCEKVHRYTALEAKSRCDAGKQAIWGSGLYAACREIFRRLIWKQGWRDGPIGWAFCMLSGWSEWELIRKHRRLSQGS